MSVTYAIPDLHGRLDLLETALEEIVHHSGGRGATVVTLGDYVDRGPSSCQVIARLMNWTHDKLKLVSLKGNHEAMMWEACNRLAELSWWIDNGGGETLASYSSSFQEIGDLRVVPLAHLRWISNLPLMHVDNWRVFVHAAVDPKVGLDQQSEQTLLWKRYPKGFGRGHGQRHVVHGHDASPKAPIVATGKTNLDGLAWKTGRLVVGIFEDEQPGGALDFLEIIGQPHQN